MENGEEGRSQIKYMSIMIMAIYSFAAVGICLFCKEIVVIMSEQSYVDAWKMVPFFVAAQLIAFIYYSHVQALMYNVKMSKFTVFCSSSGLVVNIVVSILLVKIFDIYGILIASLLSKSVMATLTVIVSRKAEEVDFGLKKMILYIIIASALIGLGMLVSLQNVGLNLFEILLKLLILALAAMIFIFPYRKDFLCLILGLLKRKPKR